MNKKRNFAKMALLSALLCGLASPTFVGCKDYDDDIKNLQEQVDANKTLIASIQEAIANKKFISDYKPVENGYELIFSDGSKLSILNGAKGEQGLQGIQGIQGPKGDPGVSAAAIIPKFRVNEGFWEISVDEGKTYEQVLNENGEPVKAGAEASEAISIDKDGFLVIGGETTKLNVNPKCPAITYNEENKTFVITVDGHSMIIPEEGSDYNGLQTLIYRKMAVDDYNDYVWLGSLSYTPKSSKVPVLLMTLPGKAEFKVFPKTFDTEKATYEFFDTHLSRAENNTPSLTYVDGSAKVNDGILSVEFSASNLNVNKYGENAYLSSLNVTLNNNTACSDYFSVYVEALKAEEAEFFVKSAKDLTVPEDQVDQMLAGKLKEDDKDASYHYNFVYTESYSLKDSVALGYYTGEKWQSLEQLGFGKVIKVSYAPTEDKENGIFQIDPETGVITVAKDKQGSAINEYCYVTVTYAFMDQKGVKVLEVAQDLAIQAVKEKPTTPEVQGIQIVTFDGTPLNLIYSTEKQVIKLNVRDFESQLGGRDLLNPDNKKTNSKVWGLGYMDKEVLKAVTTTLPADAAAIDLKNPEVKDGEMYLYFLAGENETTSLDALYLIVGAKTKMDVNTYFALNKALDGKASINNKNFYLKDLEVKREVEIALKPEYKLTMTGVWATDGTYAMISENLNLMYNVVKPSDLELEFALSKDQSAEVKTLIADGQLVLDPTTNKITISPAVDLAKKQLYVKYDIFDKNEAAATRKPLQSDQLKIQNPVGSLTGTVADQTFQVVNLTDTYNTVNDGNKSLTLKDVRNNSLLKYTKETAAGKDDAKYEMSSESEAMYGTEAGFGITYDLDKAAKEFGIKIDNNGIITLDEAKISSGINFEKTTTVTMTITHDWGTTSVSYSVVVKKTN